MSPYFRRLLPLLVFLAGGYWLAMFVLTHVPSVELPDINYIDKVYHAAGYAVLAFALSGVFTLWRGYDQRMLLLVWIVVATYAAIDEYTQQFVLNRSSDKFDFLADIVGAALGLLGLLACLRLSSRCEAVVPSDKVAHNKVAAEAWSVRN